MTQSHSPLRADRLTAVLTAGFSPLVLKVIDDSAHHAGHMGAAAGGQTHYSVLIVSEAFRDMNRVARSRAVHEALAAEFAGGMHALALRLRTPEEQARAGD
jgi:BolA protein